MKHQRAESKNQQRVANRLWWIPALGFGIALLLLVANGWVAMEMTSQFREYGSEFLKEQTTEQLKSLAEEESQLIELALQSLMRDRSPNDLLTEEFSILFTYDLVAVINRDESIIEAYLFNENGRRKIEEGSPWHIELSNSSDRLDFRPVNFRFVSATSGLYLIYSIRDPRDFSQVSLVLGRKMPDTFEAFSGNSKHSFRVIAGPVESNDMGIQEIWDLSKTLSLIHI